MKKLFLTVLLFVLLLDFASPVCALEGLVKFSGKKNATVFLELAVTDEEKAKGLMDRFSLAEDRGMVFIFRPAKQVTFFMKNTFIPLDMIFINNGKIVKIVKNAIPNREDILYPSESDVTEVVEVNGGFTNKHDIKIRDEVIFENIAQIDYAVKSKLMIKK